MTEQSPGIPGTVKKLSDDATFRRQAKFSDTTDFRDFYNNNSGSIPSIVVIIDSRGTVQMFNRKAAEITGFMPGSIVGKDAFAMLFPESLQEQAESLLLCDIGRYGDLTNIYFPMLTCDGRTLPVTWDISAMRDDQGALLGAVCIGHYGLEANSFEPSAAIGNMICGRANDTMHAILNHNQVAIGYLELAIEQIKPENELRCMLDHVYKALQRSSDLALDAYRTSRDAPSSCEYALRAGRKNL